MLNNKDVNNFWLDCRIHLSSLCLHFVLKSLSHLYVSVYTVMYNTYTHAYIHVHSWFYLSCCFYNESVLSTHYFGCFNQDLKA